MYEEVIAGAAGAGPDNGDDWGGKAGTADLALLGDRWLQPAIRRGALRPFEDADSYRCGVVCRVAWRVACLVLVFANTAGGAQHASWVGMDVEA